MSAELTDKAARQFRELQSQLPDDFEQARAVLTGMTANWPILTPEEVKRARDAGVNPTKPRASAQELAERRIATSWLTTTADRPLSRRGVAYRAEALLGLPKTETVCGYIEYCTHELRDSGLLDWELIRDGRRTTLRHGRYNDVPDALRALAHWYERVLWADAPVKAQVWIEKEDIATALAPHAQALGLDVWPASGFTEAGFLRGGMKKAGGDGRPLVIFGLGPVALPRRRDWLRRTWG